MPPGALYFRGAKEGSGDYLLRGTLVVHVFLALCNIEDSKISTLSIRYLRRIICPAFIIRDNKLSRNSNVYFH